MMRMGNLQSYLSGYHTGPANGPVKGGSRNGLHTCGSPIRMSYTEGNQILLQNPPPTCVLLPHILAFSILVDNHVVAPCPI